MAAPQSVNLLDLMTPADKGKVDQIEKAKSDVVTKEWMAISELGYYYGWQAIKDCVDDVITLGQARLLIEGARKIHSMHVYDTAIATAAGTSNKKGGFKKLMDYYVKDVKAVM